MLGKGAIRNLIQAILALVKENAIVFAPNQRRIDPTALHNMRR